eukprot:211605_1
MSRKKPTGAPKTWRKTHRMSPMQRFKMYNPMQMEFSNNAVSSAYNPNISFGLNRKQQQQLQKIEINRIKKTKKEMTKTISKTMNQAPGKIKTFGTEKTFEITQDLIGDLVDNNTSKKIFDLDLQEHAPYKIDYTSNGQYLALCGQKGHLSIIRWSDFRLISEEYFDITTDYIHDVKFAFNESMLCVAQREGVYIYNTKCVETHVLRRSIPFPLALEYLPYHFLLCSIGLQGKLVYFDVSIGKKITTKKTKLGQCDLITQNPRNAIIHLGHNNGTVTLWTPTNEQPVARILCHKSRVRGLAVNHTGYQMATSDDNGYLKIWDLRMFREIYNYKSNSMISCMDYSQKGLLAFSTGKTAVIWNIKNSFKPCDNNGSVELQKRHKKLYLQHSLDRRLITSLKFCPYEDILGIGNTKGFSSLVIPGAGEPNYDLFENDPFETMKKRNNKIVYKLLDKLTPEMIQLDPNFIAAPPKKSVYVEYKRNKELDKKWARKNVTKNVKNGYRGVLRKRNAKFVHMRDLHLRQEMLKRQLNVRKKLKSKAAKAESMERKDRVVKHITKRKDAIPSALGRFSGPKQTNHQQFKSKWRRRQKKIYH